MRRFSYLSMPLLVIVISVSVFYIFKFYPSISADSVIEGPAVLSFSANLPAATDNASAEAKTASNVPQASAIAPLDLSDISLPIFMYHHIRDYNDPNDLTGTNLSVSVAKFGQALDFILANGYQTITFKDLSVGQIPAKPIILTFDDGYADFYDNAYPELEKRGMTGVVFVIRDKMGGDYMTSEELTKVSNKGIEIGSHTISHSDLTIISATKAGEEITQSKLSLEILTGSEIISFCYPTGAFNQQVEDMVFEAGYKFAVTTKTGRGDFANSYEIKRYRITNDTYLSAYLK